MGTFQMPNVTGKTMVKAAIGVFAAATAYSSVVNVDQTERGVDYRFGKMTTQTVADLRTPGLNFKLPFVTDIRKVKVSQSKRDYDNVVTYTKDNQKITARLSVFFRVPEGKIIEIYNNNPDWEGKLETAVESSYKNALGTAEAQFVAQHREEIMKGVTKETNEQISTLLGIEVTQVLMPNYDFDKEFDRKVSEAANAKADLNRKQTELEQSRVDAQKKVVEAGATADSRKKTAEAEAYEIEAKAKADATGKLAKLNAEAQGFNNVASAIGRDNMGTYLLTSKWQGSGQIVPMVSGSTGGTIVDLRQVAPQATAPAVAAPTLH